MLSKLFRTMLAKNAKTHSILLLLLVSHVELYKTCSLQEEHDFKTKFY